MAAFSGNPHELGVFSTRLLLQGEWLYFEGLLCTAVGILADDHLSHALTCSGIGTDARGRGSTKLMGIQAVCRPAHVHERDWLLHVNECAHGLGAASFVNSRPLCNAVRPAPSFRSGEMHTTSTHGGAMYHTADGCMKPMANDVMPLKLIRDVPQGDELFWNYVVHPQVPTEGAIQCHEPA